MQKLRVFSIVAMAIGLMAGANADTITTPVISSGEDGSRPMRGISKERVESKWGSPVSKIAAVGDPPISRWEYPEFTVYFEYDRVIHAVLKR